MGRPPRVTREEVLRAARREFGEGGFHGTTLARIAGRLGITAAGLLRHAPTKAALFRAAFAPGPGGGGLPTDFLARVPGGADPREVLGRLARSLVPFLESRVDESVVFLMHGGSRSGRSTIRLRLPFDPRSPQAPPRRALAAVERYLRRAGRAGRVRVRDPRAASALFLGSLRDYVLSRRVLGVDIPGVPLERYVETLLDIWTHGAFRAGDGRPAAPGEERS